MDAKDNNPAPPVAWAWGKAKSGDDVPPDMRYEYDICVVQEGAITLGFTCDPAQHRISLLFTCEDDTIEGTVDNGVDMARHLQDAMSMHTRAIGMSYSIVPDGGKVIVQYAYLLKKDYDAVVGRISSKYGVRENHTNSLILEGDDASEFIRTGRLP